MAWFRAGTVSVTNGSAVVTGANTDFVSNTQQGEAFLGPDGRVYEVGLVISATQISLTGNYQGASAGGQGYALMPTSSFARDLALGAAQLLNSFAGVRDGIGAGLFPDGTLAAPAFRFSADQDTGVNRLAANTLALVAGGVARATVNGDGVTVAGAVSIGNGTFAAANFSTNLGNWSCGIPDGANRWRVIENQFGSEKLAIESAGAVRPGGDNGQSLGAGAYRWSVVYAGTGSINTSDARTKEDIEPVPDSWLDAWGDVVWSRFRFRDAVEHKGSDARWHLGLIAQDVRDAFAAHDLDATEIGLLCFDRWDAVAASPATETTRDADGKVIVPASPGSPARAAGDRWGLRYDECQAMEAAWQRRRIAQLEARLNLLADQHS